MRPAPRRLVLAALGGAAVAPAPVLAASSPDAELVGWCARLLAVAEEYEAQLIALGAVEVEDAPPEVTARLAALDAEEEDLHGRIMATGAGTMAGLAAMARLRLKWEVLRADDAFFTDRLGEAISRDLLAGDPAFLAEVDAAHERRRAAWAALAARPKPAPPAYHDTRTPAQRVEGSRRMVRVALQLLREAQADMRAVAAVAV